MEGVLWGSIMHHPCSLSPEPEPGVRGVPLVGCVPTCCSCATTVVGRLVRRAVPWPSCLRGLAAAVVGTLTCWLVPRMAVCEAQLRLLRVQRGAGVDTLVCDASLPWGWLGPGLCCCLTVALVCIGKTSLGWASPQRGNRVRQIASRLMESARTGSNQYGVN